MWHRLGLGPWLLGVVLAVGLAAQEVATGPQEDAKPPDAADAATPPAGNNTLTSSQRAAIAEDWLIAIAGGRQGLAIRSAARLVDANAAVPVEPYYREMAKHRELPTNFYATPFTRWDYQSWRHAYLIQRLSLTAPRGTLPEVTAIFNLVCETVKPEERVRDYATSPWPYWILMRGWGVCDRMSWALAELLYQRGYETQIVYLMDQLQRDSKHTILEVRSTTGKVWVADPFSGVLLPDYSVDRLARDQAKLDEIWPDLPVWHEQIRYAVMFTPAFPQDYCWRNQELAKVLKPLLGDRLPRFGEDPRQRTINYRQLRQKELGDKLSFTMGLWFYPFQLLRNDMRMEAQGQ